MGDYGTTQHKGKNYQVTCEAWIDNKGTNGDVVYIAYAIDDNNKKYRVVWYTTEKYNKCSELYNLEEEKVELLRTIYISQAESDRLTKVESEIALLESEGYEGFYCEQSENACDWDNADEVEEVE